MEPETVTIPTQELLYLLRYVRTEALANVRSCRAAVISGEKAVKEIDGLLQRLQFLAGQTERASEPTEKEIGHLLQRLKLAS
jgi:hypothetical protein